MKRREFITILCGAATAWPLAARAQQPRQLRRIGVLMNRASNDPEGQARMAAFQEALRKLGWTGGANVQIDIRYGEDNIDVERKYAAELIALAPDIILASGTVSMTALQPLGRTVPIVFAVVADPVGAGFVNSLAQPGGNATGFMLYEYGLSGKWVELLKQIAPSVTRAAILRDPTNPAGLAYFGAPGYGTVARDGCEPSQHARCRGDRTRRDGLRTLCKWRPDRDAELLDFGSSRSDY
jgi:putative ABC transport system substrate-binding protein